jgi:acyl-CoA synthetase (AMP-forming)/AMP-acid ligase II
MNIGSLITRHARYRPEHLAVVFEGERLSWAALNARSNRLANALLAAGLAKGDKIATVLPNCLELLCLFMACAKTGMVIVPLSPLLMPAGIASLIKDSDAVMVVTSPELTEMIEPVRGELAAVERQNFICTGAGCETYRTYDALVAGAPKSEPPDAGLADDDVYNIFYSSGTTGQPKGIIHTHYIRAMYGMEFASCWRMTPESVVLHAGAIIFNGAFLTLMPWLYLGATLVLLKSFDVGRYIAAAASEKATHVMMVPSQIVAVIDHESFSPDKFRSLEMLLTVGAPLHLEHKKRVDELLPGRFYELYGLTEGFFTVLDRDDFRRKPASVGVPITFSDMRIIGAEGTECAPGEVGEITGRSPSLMPRYYKRPDLTAGAIRDGWLYSGDMGWVDEDGFLYLADRKKDMIISGGVNVFPRDIEEIVAAHDAVREVAVFGIANTKWGETPVAAVVLKEAAPPQDEAAMRDWINARVGAKFQRVAKVIFMDAFPLNAAGKILKRELRERFSSET